MYSGEPQSVSASPWGAKFRAKPKSAIFKRGVAVASDSKRFWGFKSRCTADTLKHEKLVFSI
jgi:hypothetical protein